jgi:hypothetical protein
MLAIGTTQLADQGALHLHAQLPQKWLAGVQINVKDLEMCKLRRAVELLENRPLFRAGRAPRRLDEDKDRVAALLRRFEGGLLIRLDGRGVRDAVCTDTRCQDKGGENGQFLHGLDSPQSGW